MLPPLPALETTIITKTALHHLLLLLLRLLLLRLLLLLLPSPPSFLFPVVLVLSLYWAVGCIPREVCCCARQPASQPAMTPALRPEPVACTYVCVVRELRMRFPGFYYLFPALSLSISPGGPCPFLSFSRFTRHSARFHARKSGVQEG